MQFYERALTTYNKYADDPKKKDYVALVATILLLIVLFVLIYPAAIHVFKLNKEVSDGKAQLKTLKTNLTNLEQARANFQQIGGDLTLLNQALPIGSGVKDYLKTPLEALAAQHSLGFKSFQATNVPVSVPPPTQTLSLRYMTYTASFTGTYPNFQEFLSGLESFIRITKVSGFTIAKDESAKEPVFTVTGNAAFLDAPITDVPNQTETTTNAQ